MEGKEPIKIKLSTAIIFILIIFVLVGYIILEKKYTDVKKYTETSNVINNDIVKDTNTTEKKEENTKVEKEEVFSEKELKEAIQRYAEIIAEKEASPINLLEYLGFGDELTIESENSNEELEYYIKTKVKYSEFKEKMLHYVSEKWFEEMMKSPDADPYPFYKEHNGYVYCFDGGASGYGVKVKSVKKNKDDSYIAEIDTYMEDVNTGVVTYEFSVIEYNGKCVIDNCESK